MERTIDGRYEVQRVLGGGARGTVYLAKQAMLGREVAIAVFLPTAEPAPFARELEILSELDHPNVARILDGGRTAEGESFLVMEVVKGEPLRCALAKGSRRVWAVLRDVAEGLAALHAAGLAHRALRAESIVLTPDGAAKIVDLGCATATDDIRQDMFQFALLVRDCLAAQRDPAPDELAALVQAWLSAPEAPGPLGESLRADAAAPPTARAAADLLARLGRRSPVAPPQPPKARAPRRAGTLAMAALALASIAVAGAALLPVAVAPPLGSVALHGPPPSLSALRPSVSGVSGEVLAAVPSLRTKAPIPAPSSSTSSATPTRAAPRPVRNTSERGAPAPLRTSPPLSSSSAYHDVWRKDR